MVLRTGDFLSNGDQTKIKGRESKYKVMLYSEIRRLKVWYKFAKVLKQPSVSISKVYPKNKILLKPKRENSKSSKSLYFTIVCVVSSIIYLVT